MLLQDKVAVVSGVGPGLGKEIALALAREGAGVVLGARTESYLKDLAAEIERAGGRALYAPTDITDRRAVPAPGAHGASTGSAGSTRWSTTRSCPTPSSCSRTSTSTSGGASSRSTCSARCS